METAIEIKNLNIDYRGINHISIQQLIKNPALKGGQVVHALRGVDLCVEKGEILGIIGENGAGKSTLLKAVAGIFQPDSGTITTNGGRVSLMSLGVGFKWDLSGRENIMLAGLLLRYPASYIKQKIPEIIEFSELGDAIDRPVRTYSSGMYSKLSFAITAVLETDIMLIDELLSVGDEHFQGKSFSRIQELAQRDSVTGLIVSHDMDLVRDMCTRVVWMHEGSVQASGDPEKIINMYVRASAALGAPKVFIRGAAEAVEKVLLFAGIEPDEKNGLLKNPDDNYTAMPRTAASWEPVFLETGDDVKITGALYKVFFYKDEVPEEMIYTSIRSPEGNRTVYDPQSSVLYWQDSPEFRPQKAGYYRFVLQKKSGEGFSGKETLEDFAEIYKGTGAGSLLEDKVQNCNSEKGCRPILDASIADTVRSVKSNLEDNDAVILTVADTHFCFGGNWQDTLYCINRISRELAPDAVVHLGDITDGSYPPELFAQVLRRIKRDINTASGASAFFCAGNHDLLVNDHIVCADGTSSYPDIYGDVLGQEQYYHDIKGKNLRLICLRSIAPQRSVPYYFSDETAEWLRNTLDSMPEGCKALIFSHISPSLEKTGWGEHVEGGKDIIRTLKAFWAERPGSICGYFYGHEHVAKEDDIGFPLVGVGCACLEDHKGCRPLSDGRFHRIKGTPSQELFNVVIVKENGKIINYPATGSR